jgi:hypothetical protein
MVITIELQVSSIVMERILFNLQLEFWDANASSVCMEHSLIGDGNLW